MERENVWGWPVAGYLFLGGLGGGMVIVSTVADLFFGQGRMFASGNFVAAVLVGLGSALLIFELGRPFQFWRVFSRQKAIMTVGAWLLGLLMLCSVAYGSFWLSFLPWYGFDVLRLILAWVNLLLGAGVVAYTGVLLGSMKARPFWNSPALPVLFLVSGLSTGVAAQSLLAGLWPWDGIESDLVMVESFLRASDGSLLVLEVFVLMVYVLMMRTVAPECASRSAETWLTGHRMLPFWGGLVGLGLIGPLLLYALGQGAMLILAPLAVLIGGLILRFLVVYTDDRKTLPGEEQFFARLPHEDEPFLHAWDYD